MLSIGIWSFFGILHAAIRPGFSLIGFMVARFGLGFGEAGNFPACIKTVGEWFPRKERAFATGIFNAGTNVGAILCPIAVPWLYAHLGWQSTFYITGATKFVRDGQPAKATSFGNGERVTVAGSRDARMNLLAVKVENAKPAKDGEK